MPDFLLVSCEHGGHDIPPRYRSLFRGSSRELRSHRGFDAGALWLARRLARHLGAPLYASTTSRLLVDLNRSLHNRAVFSAPVRRLPREERGRIVSRFFTPHRERIARAIRDRTSDGRRVLHLAVHTFTPVFDGQVRTADIGLLYDPHRSVERHACYRWKLLLREAAPDLTVRRNYPYRGYSDGLTTHLRRTFPPRQYLGVELEVNQRHVQRTGAVARTVTGALLATVDRLTAELATAGTH